MFIPDGLSEPYVLERIEQVTRLLAPRFVFGYYVIGDIRQYARLFALRALPKYESGGFDDAGEPRRKLENFLYVVVRSRLKNLVRDEYFRNEPPCKLCHQGREHEHPDGQVCKRYATWRSLNETKMNVVRPVGLDDLVPDLEAGLKDTGDVETNGDVTEAESLLDAGLPADLRSDYLRMRAGARLPRHRREKVQEACREILAEFLGEADEGGL